MVMRTAEITMAACLGQSPIANKEPWSGKDTLLNGLLHSKCGTTCVTNSGKPPGQHLRADKGLTKKGNGRIRDGGCGRKTEFPWHSTDVDMAVNKPGAQKLAVEVDFGY